MIPCIKIQHTPKYSLTLLKRIDFNTHKVDRNHCKITDGLLRDFKIDGINYTVSIYERSTYNEIIIRRRRNSGQITIRKSVRFSDTRKIYEMIKEEADNEKIIMEREEKERIEKEREEKIKAREEKKHDIKKDKNIRHKKDI